MKQVLFTLMLLATSLSMLSETATCKIVISDLPYTEGTLFISAKEGKQELLRAAVEVDSTTVVFAVDFSKVWGKQVFIQAFQDLNDDRQLNFDNYGRPAEPFLRTGIEPKEGDKEYGFKLSVIQ